MKLTKTKWRVRLWCWVCRVLLKIPEGMGNSTQSAIDRFVEHYGEISAKSMMKFQGTRDPEFTEDLWRAVYRGRGQKTPRHKRVLVDFQGRAVLKINNELLEARNE